MQDRVLDAADILVDRQPVVGRLARERAILGVGVGRSARSTRSSRRRCRRCRSRAAPAPPQRGQSTTVQVGWRSSGLPGREKSTSSGSVDRQLLARHRHDAAGARSGSPGSGSPSSAGARRPSRAGARWSRRGPAPSALQLLDHPPLAGLDVEPVEEARVEQPAVADIGLGADRRRSPGRHRAAAPPAAPAGRSLRAKSRSRWSCAGQPKMAPVP